ncbi:PHD finger domain protein [Aspergillus ellipticus CBS 707.79]|uniref:PHD finger domain protein n=1 Tax=Aspergillus ellipticus CBS 707.79 TaxID=1448320 RepID=A0A319DNA7_9EURO|nr:PHD finger domain protein [Aspergillus ellipticus CBS 707.79]
MVSRKRTRSEVDATPEQPPEEPGLLHQLQNSWEFANLMQYIAIFGKPMKIDEDFGIEDLENECLKPTPSEKLLEIGLCLLKWVSSHRGLTFDNFDEYTRRQYNAKAPHNTNPFGYDEIPNKFMEFDVFLKLRVLHQLTIWTFWNPDRIREKMPEQRENEQTEWRIEEVGYDREGRYYYILDDNRLYRRTDPPIPPPKPAKSKSRRKSARAMRASKRRKVNGADPVEESDEENNAVNGDTAEDPFEKITWECIAITLSDYQQFLESIRKTRDPDEKILRDRIEEQVLPIIEKEEESQQRQKQKREKELFNLQLIAGAKRSSRIAGKAEKERHEREAAEAALKREVELSAARKEEERVTKLEAERRSRIITREQRIKDRERKRILHESELQRIEEEQKKVERGESRASERHLRAEMERYRKNLEDLSQEDQWIFDCSGCGVHGQNLDDGSHSVACETCNVWQHSKCLGIAKDEAERDDFHFICEDCKRREEEARLPKLPPLKFRVGSSTSPSATAVEGDTKIKGPDMEQTPTPSMREAKHTFELPLGGSPVKQPPPPFPSVPPQNQTVSFPPPSPERRPQSAHTTSFSPPRAPFSPTKGMNGSTPSSKERFSKLPSLHQTMHLPPHNTESFNGGSLPARRPSSSHSGRSPTLPSPIQNRPSMSPTQGNRDVGPLAGFPPVASSDHSVPWTPYGQQQTPRPNTGNHASLSMHSGRPSFMATPTGSQSSPPQSSHGVPFSGISPTKQSPRPMTSGGVTGAPVLPPIQKLEPSPKLMGRSSPDAPIPPPVKCMTPEQEERRQRENAILQAQLHASNGQHSAMSSPSLNRIPPLGPSAVSQQHGPSPQPDPK